MTEKEKSHEDIAADLANAEVEYTAELLKRTEAMKAKREADEIAANALKAKEAVDKLEADELEYKEKLTKEIAASLGVKPPTEGELDINSTSGGESILPDMEKHMTFHKEFLQYKGMEKRVEYGSAEFISGEKGFAFTEAQHTCKDDIDSWSPADVYCDLIWQAAQCGRQLSGIVTMRACDINVGDGLTVQVRAINADTLGSALVACECATCVSNVFSTYPITLARYDIYKVICHLDIWDAGPALKSSMVEAMSRAFITGIDTLIYQAARDATPGYSETAAASLTCEPTNTGSCCSYAAQLYKSIVQLEARMRSAGYGSNGFYLIIHPRLAVYLKLKEGVSLPYYINNIVMDGNKLSKVGDVNVIEYCGATSCTAHGPTMDDYPVAIMIDPERAVGEAYGKKPTLKTDEDPIECDSTKIVMRAYVGIAAMDLGAIGHIVNP